MASDLSASPGTVSVPLRGKGRDQRAVAGNARTLELGVFPSPCGEKVGINPRSYAQLRLRAGVSVPLRGKGRDQPSLESGDTDSAQAAFPSPCGEKVGINGSSAQSFHQITRRFPSPCGEKVGINCPTPGYLGPWLCRFRPLAGKR